MLDRIPKYPGRFRLNPVDGQPDVFDFVRADEPSVEGSHYRKEDVLPDDLCEYLEIDKTQAEPKDGFNYSYCRIADIKLSTRTSLGEDYLLANGAKIEGAEYPKLFELLGGIFYTGNWTKSFAITAISGGRSLPSGTLVARSKKYGDTIYAMATASGYPPYMMVCNGDPAIKENWTITRTSINTNLTYNGIDFCVSGKNGLVPQCGRDDTKGYSLNFDNLTNSQIVTINHKTGPNGYAVAFGNYLMEIDGRNFQYFEGLPSGTATNTTLAENIAFVYGEEENGRVFLTSTDATYILTDFPEAKVTKLFDERFGTASFVDNTWIFTTNTGIYYKYGSDPIGEYQKTEISGMNIFTSITKAQKTGNTYSFWNDGKNFFSNSISGNFVTASNTAQINAIYNYNGNLVGIGGDGIYKPKTKITLPQISVSGAYAYIRVK